MFVLAVADPGFPRRWAGVPYLKIDAPIFPESGAKIKIRAEKGVGCPAFCGHLAFKN